ncbi:cytochrome c oxidase assembly factor 6 homolog [Episyrphus balteatus]|uniref:cytochrome c oxidase assembly factor 6 homolog n=1 Tax=Episyrphus balteatus TaxID=286459 RepID=UPI0024866A95|nr:cytochrome c oxidase assembly factor 6 homolog [Episyrphus balteatus]
MSFPTKDERAKCWKARDDFWACLDTHAPGHQSTSGEAVPKQCADLRKLYEKSCPSQWVKHFDRKRTYEQFKEKVSKGFDPLEQKEK